VIQGVIKQLLDRRRRRSNNARVPLPKNLVGKITGELDPPPELIPDPVTQVVVLSLSVRCQVCAHPQRAEIERRYVTTKPSGISSWLVEQGFQRVTASVIKKHFIDCVVGELILSKGAAQSAENFKARVEKLVSRCEGYLDEFDDQDSGDNGIKAPKDWKGLSGVLNQLRTALELYGKACGHLGPDSVINIIESPQFQAIIVPIAQITATCAQCGPTVERLLTEDGS
jgi:hypothetical protein